MTKAAHNKQIKQWHTTLRRATAALESVQTKAESFVIIPERTQDLERLQRDLQVSIALCKSAQRATQKLLQE